MKKMASKANKKRKYEDENRGFNPEWKEDYAFISQENKPLCLNCNQFLSQNKDSNLKRHHETNHKNFSNSYPPKSKKKKKQVDRVEI